MKHQLNPVVTPFSRLCAFWDEFEQLESAGELPPGFRELCEAHERAAMTFAVAKLEEQQQRPGAVQPT